MTVWQYKCWLICYVDRTPLCHLNSSTLIEILIINVNKQNLNQLLSHKIICASASTLYKYFIMIVIFLYSEIITIINILLLLLLLLLSYCSVAAVDWCADVECLNGATCLNRPVGFLCICPPGFTGIYCELGKLVLTRLSWVWLLWTNVIYRNIDRSLIRSSAIFSSFPSFLAFVSVCATYWVPVVVLATRIWVWELGSSPSPSLNHPLSSYSSPPLAVVWWSQRKRLYVPQACWSSSDGFSPSVWIPQ